MNNNGLIEYKENFITKIRNFFFKLFKKKIKLFKTNPKNKQM